MLTWAMLSDVKNSLFSQESYMVELLENNQTQFKYIMNISRSFVIQLVVTFIAALIFPATTPQSISDLILFQTT